MTLSLCGGTLNFDEVGYTSSEWGDATHFHYNLRTGTDCAV